MKLKQVTIAALTSVIGIAASAAPTSSFIDNGGVHEAYEYGADQFTLPTTSILDKFTFTLATETTLFATASTLAAGPISGTVQLFSDALTDTQIGSTFALSGGSETFSSLGAGNYYYLVSATASKGGSFLLGSYATAVPEPETYALMLGGLGLMGFIVSRRKT